MPARIHELASWTEFVEAVRTGPTKATNGGVAYPDEVLYRGHAKPDWPLWSPLDRRLVTWVRGKNGTPEYWSARKTKGLAWYDNVCERVLSQFKQLCNGLTGIEPMMSDDEYWALGRHFGLLTPFLDWALSPYVAAFFAFTERLRQMEHGGGSYTLKGSKGIVRVWALALWEPVEIPGEFEIIRSRGKFGARQRAQSSVFTKLRSQDYLELEPYLESRGLGDYLVGYDLPLDAAAHAWRDLQLMNIMPATLFPDIYGAAWQANIDSSRIHFASTMYDWKPPEADPGPS